MKIILSSKERDAIDRLLYTVVTETGGEFLDLARAVDKAGGTLVPGMGQHEVAFSEKLTLAALNAVHGTVKIGIHVGRTVYALVEVAKGALQNVERSFKEELARDD